MLKKLVCLPRILFLFFSILFGITTISNATVTIHPDREAEGFSKVNEFALPAGIPIPLGDLVFSDDGNTLYILGGSETAESGVWSVSVTRDPVSGRVTGLGTATLFFSFSPNPGSIDTSLEFHPSGNGTLFFRTNDVDPVTFLPVEGGGDVGERTSDGTITLFQVDGSVRHFGGLAFMPSELRALNGIDLLVGAWLLGITSSYSLTANEDGTFTPVFIPEKSPYSNTVGVSFATGDQHFVPSGSFTNYLMFADSLSSNFSDSTIGIIEIDPLTGFPVTGADIIPFASGFDPGAWGLEFDPITNDLFVSLFNFDADPPNRIIQISGFHDTVFIDIKPKSCPNPLNIRSRGKLPVAIVGTGTFDVTLINLDTIRLNGVEPIKISFENVTAPSELEPCDCEEFGPDSYEDLVLKFDTQEIVATLGEVTDGEEIRLTLTGNLLDAERTLIEGVDCVLIKDKRK